MNKGLFSNLGSDLPAGLVVFLVALPLCLGIALASGAPLFSGIIAGVIGGIVIGAISGSHTSVSGPAAGLTVIVLNAITELGTFELFLSAVFLAGIFQMLLGILKAGLIGYYFPTSVIKGMLAGIGIILIIKQLPYALGLTGELSQAIFLVNDPGAAQNLYGLFDNFLIGAILISLVSLAILVLWDRPVFRNHRVVKYIPGPLLVVLVGIGLNEGFRYFIPHLYLGDQKVRLPEITGVPHFLDQFTTLDFTGFLLPNVWIAAVSIAIIASLETLLSLEAADKIDPYKRISPPNKELLAQGAGNILNGLVGGLPVTAVIVRSSANITAGGKTKVSAIFHGFLLLASVLFIPTLLNLIPLASLAAILILIGYKLAKISLFRLQYKLGMDQFLPFFVTILGIVSTDLLKGIGMGIVVAVVFIVIRNFKNSYFYKEQLEKDPNTIHIVLAEEVSFLNKGALMNALNQIPDGKTVVVDGSNSKSIDYDVLEVIENFRVNANERDITVKTIKIPRVLLGNLH